MASDLEKRLVELARLRPGPAPVVSVYLDTCWSDEHQRERVRILLKNGIREAGEAGRADPDDLRWISEQGMALVGQAMVPDAGGVALFACRPLGLREMLVARSPFEPAFVVAETPHVVPLAAAVGAESGALLVFVDAESARLIPWGPGGRGGEVLLQSEVPGHHSRGGWAQLAQSSYQRHIQDHRDRHFEAVGRSLVALAAEWDPERIVLAGEARNAALFQATLPEPWAGRVVGHVAGARHEPAAAILDRATALLSRLAGGAEEVDQILTEAAKGGRAVAGADRTLDAISRGAVHCLYLARDFREAGRECPQCGGLARGADGACPACAAATRPIHLGNAMVARVVGAGGRLRAVEAHADLGRHGGVAARLRYPL
jgi:peptide subunit release factor 1 (eRF1)